jgi:hypothetical protein
MGPKIALFMILFVLAAMSFRAPLADAHLRPNILVITGDDIG